MSARFAIALLPLLSSCATPTVEKAEFTTQELAEACKGREGWSDPAPPARIHGNSWYVGTCGISAILVTSDKGHVLVDVGMEDAVPSIVANIEKLGFDPSEVRWIVTGHEHFDHVGGLAEMQRRTGARIAALPVAATVLENGKPHPDDPQAGNLLPLAPAKVERIMQDGEVLIAGSLRLTAYATPAHSPGSTSWTWESCAGSDCRTMTYADSASTISASGYRFTDHPDHVAEVRKGFEALAALPCGYLITPHPSASGLFERFSTGEMSRPDACRVYASNASANFARRLEQENVGG